MLHVQKTKHMPPPSPSKPVGHLHRRLFWLLLMLVFTAATVLRFALTPPSVDDDDPLKTHMAMKEKTLEVRQENVPPLSISCSSLINGQWKSRVSPSLETGVVKNKSEEGSLLCCDRTQYRTDVCYARGDVRMQRSPPSIVVYDHSKSIDRKEEKIRPYTRKWETTIMSTIDEVSMRKFPPTNKTSVRDAPCEVWHESPGVVFSTGGYTGNVYHDFNDGLIPLYLTTERFKGDVVFVVLEYHPWWLTRYGGIVRRLSKYPVIDFAKDRRVHCFQEVIVGLNIHGELMIDPSLMPNGKSIKDFLTLIGEGLGSQNQLKSIATYQKRKPKLAIFIRNQSRVILNLKDLVRSCEQIGFEVQLLNPKDNTPLSEIYNALQTADVMMGVHGAAMTHFLFMRPNTVFIQIVPLGLAWAADAYYGEPARRLGLKYEEYKVVPGESSLLRKYGRHDPVIVNPDAITKKGWSETKRVYLEGQNVKVNLRRFNKILVRVRSHVCRSSGLKC
ncbi:hypothetical protein QJS04_geneDACA003380 [Acorus gramineus]|uniref:Glycosyltransferase 61 catalytic domain-containing protein n=1 Tax=Acorus gramineus TaxID=55184 RepID=A0AAV9BMM9_ACOGR|nr:hypothetical protein QJS04_geneDACA003380 [Acorus gramineus]